jgi:hypothetical protein
MFKLAYCDKIAFEIRKHLSKVAENDPDMIIKSVDRVEWDLDENGAFNTPKKMLKVFDCNGKAYIVTVEEAPMLDKEAF